MGETTEKVALMRLLHEQYTRTPLYGVEQTMVWLRQQGFAFNLKRMRRVAQRMGVEAIYPKPRLNLPGVTEKRYP